MRIFQRNFQKPKLPPNGEYERGYPLDAKPLGAINSTYRQSISPLDALEAWRVREDNNHGHPLRWHTAAVPLQVWIEPEKDLSDMIFPILKEWELASLGEIRFRQSTLETADIKLIWVDEPIQGREYEVGHTDRIIKGRGWIIAATVTLLRQPKIDRTLNEATRQLRLRATILHEFGHVLGLEHSDYPQDIMHYRGWRNYRLSQNDVIRLRNLYKTPSPFLQWI